MQWKIPFSDYLKSERKNISQISEEYTNESKVINKTVVKQLSDNAIKERLTPQQLAVIEKFPQFFETSERKKEKFDKLINQWKPQSDVWPLVYNNKLILIFNSVTAFYITHYFRRSFKLANGRTAVLNTYVPSLALPLFFGLILHQMIITSPLISGAEKCSICQSMTAGLIQTTTSTLFPTIFASLGSIYFADYFNTYPFPDNMTDKTSRSYLYHVLFKSLKRNRFGLAFAGISNFLFAFYLTNKERETIQYMYFTLLRKEYEKSPQNHINN